MISRADLDAPKTRLFESVTGVGSWKQHKATYRQGACPGKGDCPILQFADPMGNPDLSGIDYSALVPGGDAIVLSRMKWRGLVPDADRLYKAGANLELRFRTTYFVAYRDQGDDYGPVSDGTQIARYKILSTLKSGTGTMNVVSSGMIVACTVPHPAGTNGSFIGCAHAHRLMSIDSTYGVPFRALLNARHCTSAGITSQRPDSIAAQCETQRTAKMNALAGLVPPARRGGFMAAVKAASGNESIDPYWFPCPAGCCTASTTLF